MCFPVSVLGNQSKPGDLLLREASGPEATKTPVLAWCNVFVRVHAWWTFVPSPRAFRSLSPLRWIIARPAENGRVSR